MNLQKDKIEFNESFLKKEMFRSFKRFAFN